MSNRNQNNVSAVFIARGIVIPHMTESRVEAHAVAADRGGVVWQGSETLTGDVPSALGRMLANPHLGYGQALGKEDLAQISHHHDTPSRDY
jgi:hypothetical protein